MNSKIFEKMIKAAMPDQIITSSKYKSPHERGIVSLFRDPETGEVITSGEYRKRLKIEMETHLGRKVSKKELNLEINRNRKWREENGKINNPDLNFVANLQGRKPIIVMHEDRL